MDSSEVHRSLAYVAVRGLPSPDDLIDEVRAPEYPSCCKSHVLTDVPASVKEHEPIFA